jgi:redox-sensitive bicupin YhaK (pirin superfamily)
LVMSGGLFHGVQLWVNLPANKKLIPPAYQGIEAAAVELAASADAGALVRVIAGEVGGHRGPGSTHTSITLIHATASPGARLQLPWARSLNALIYVLAGDGRVGTEGRPLRAGQLAVLGRGDWFEVRAGDHQDSRSPALEVLILGGQPIREPVAAYGPFVMNTETELGQALEDFEAGLFGQIPPDALMPYVPDPAPIRIEHTGI